MELKDLVGEHELSGLDLVTIKSIEDWESDADAYLFILDGITYKATEDPNDGYRSNLKDIEISEEKISYVFPPQKVLCTMKDAEEYSNNDVLQMHDSINGKLVLEIGTDNYDDYYPICIMSWHPENLSINA